MPDTDNNPKPTNKPAYRVLDWGAGTKDGPCTIYYTVGGVEKSAQAGDVITDLSPASIGRKGQEDIRTLILGTHIEEAE